jgi:type VI secretion system protein ImpE
VEVKQLLRSGRLAEAREQLVAEVKAAPADQSLRTMLFQALVFSGEWEKAQRHLDAIVLQNPQSETGVQVYTNLLHAEKERLEVITEGRRPSFLPETPAYFDTYLSAWQDLLAHQLDSAKEQFIQINKDISELSGTINGKKFSGFSDTDQFLSRFLECFTYERYVLIPFEAIRELCINAPKNLFDLIWIEARVTTWGGLNINCYLPVLYPESYRHGDDLVRMGRITDWQSLGDDCARGLGQHVFQVGAEEMGILEIGEIIFSANQ